VAGYKKNPKDCKIGGSNLILEIEKSKVKVLENMRIKIAFKPFFCQMMKY